MNEADAHALIAFGLVMTGAGLCFWWTWRQIWRLRAQRHAYQASLVAFRWSPNMTPLQFERCCADYLALHGWRARTTVASGDQGVDVFAEKAGVSVVLQCKLYSRAVGNKAVQEVLAGRMFQNAHHAAVVSNATYTPAARQLAARTGVRLLHFTDLSRADVLFPSR